VIYLEHRKNPKELKMDFIHIRVPTETKFWFKAYAAQNQTSVQEILAKLISDFRDKKISGATR